MQLTKNNTMPTCQLIRRPLPKRTHWRKWATNAAQSLAVIAMFALLITLAVLVMAL